MGSVFFRKENLSMFIILIFGLFIKLSIVDYGMPYIFHPDESIYKDPFKILFNYINLNFSSSTNLYYWILTLWYALFYVVGYIIAQINSFADFQTMLVSESPYIIIYGRILSILLSLIGTGFLFQIVKKVTKNIFLQLLFGLTIVLNPIEIISDLWIKFDPAAYCIFSILIYLSYCFIVEKNIQLRSKIYILSFVALSVRIDLIAFLIVFIFLDFTVNYSKNKLREYLKTTWSIIGIGVLLYSIITFYFVKIIFITFFNNYSANSIPVEATIEGFIISQSFNLSSFLNLLNNLKFYFLYSSLITFGPLTLFFVLYFFIKNFTQKLAQLFFMITIILGTGILQYYYSAPHYFLLTSAIILLTSILAIASIKSTRLKYSVALFNLFYIGSISIQIIYTISQKTDTRIFSMNYLLENTTHSDLIAIENYLKKGSYPPIDKCPDVLMEMARITKKYNLGTGETLIKKAQMVDQKSCRNILEIDTPKRFINTEYENIWSIDYDPILLLKWSPEFIVTTHNYQDEESSTSYAKTIVANYRLENENEISFFDSRIKMVLSREDYFPTLYIYKKNK